MILDNQKEQLSLLRQFAALTQKEYVEVVEDVLPKKLEAVAELEQFNNLLFIAFHIISTLFTYG